MSYVITTAYGRRDWGPVCCSCRFCQRILRPGVNAVHHHSTQVVAVPYKSLASFAIEETEGGAAQRDTATPLGRIDTHPFACIVCQQIHLCVSGMRVSSRRTEKKVKPTYPHSSQVCPVCRKRAEPLCSVAPVPRHTRPKKTKKQRKLPGRYKNKRVI